MRKLVLIFTLCLLSFAGFAQIPTLQQRLYYTCKVWGFVKYYHSEVSTCQVNWDSVLLHVLPMVRSAATSGAFNDALDTMLMAAGPMDIATTALVEPPAELKRNKDWGWLSDPVFRADVWIQLDSIKNNFRPHASCWVENNTYTTPYGGWLVFPHDSMELNINTTVTFPTQDQRQLMLFKYWNIIRYFNPYNYVLDVPVDTTLLNYVVPMENVSDSQSLFFLYLKISKALDDAHVYGTTYSTTLLDPPGFYHPAVRLNYTGGQYVVIKSLVPGIAPGDVILSADGLTPTQWEDSLRPYISAGNPSVFHRAMCSKIMGRMVNGSVTTVVVEDSMGAPHTFPLVCTHPSTNSSFFYSDYYPADSLGSIKWTTMGCDIGYVNMGNLQPADVNAMHAALKNKDAIIFDIRNYPNGTAWDIADLMYPAQLAFAKNMIPNVLYPGTYTWNYGYAGVPGNPTPYTGKVILLMNQESQSHAEYTCMILEAMPNVVKVGSQTAGADGNITYWKISQDLRVGFTTLGIFYPLGDSTQRIGIVPDSVVYPSREGIRHHNDDVLNKALEIACAPTGLPGIKSITPFVRVYPNPANDLLKLDAGNITDPKILVCISDITGRVVQQRELDGNNGNFSASFDIRKLSPGMYFVTVKAGEHQIVTKIVKE